MMPLPLMLSHWIADPTGARIRPVFDGGFSGARVWHVEYRGQSFALRQWQPAMQEDRVFAIHSFQQWLAHEGLPVSTPIRAAATGQTVVCDGGAAWELAKWMPGVADYHRDPQPEKLSAAMESLARLHVAAARMPLTLPTWMTSRVSPALMKRSERLGALVLSELRTLRGAVGRLPPGAERTLAQEAFALVDGAAEAELRKFQRWENEVLPQQLCLRDVWHDHVLFTNSRVTGLVDFGATGSDSPAGDVGRLLGSLVGDDRERWRLGLAAYDSVRPLSTEERDVAAVFDSSGTVLSTANWIHWLFIDETGIVRPERRPAAIERLRGLVGRLRTQAASPR